MINLGAGVINLEWGEGDKPWGGGDKPLRGGVINLGILDHSDQLTSTQQ